MYMETVINSAVRHKTQIHQKQVTIQLHVVVEEGKTQDNRI